MVERNTVIEMYRYYDWNGRPLCTKGHKAGIKCHSERNDCKDYEPSLFRSTKERMSHDQ